MHGRNTPFHAKKVPATNTTITKNVGTPDELHTTAYNDITRKDFPYFSLMIIPSLQTISIDIAYKKTQDE